MLRFFILLAGCLLSVAGTYCQVGINADGGLPDPSSILDIRSTTKGMLVPRMSLAERDAISSPATGLLIFCKDNNLFYFNTGTQISPVWTMVNSQWVNFGQNIYYNDGNVGIGEANPTHKLTITTPLAYGGALRLIGPAGMWGYGARLEFGDLGRVFLTEDEDDRLLISVLGGTRITGGNIGIGTSAPHASAGLEVNSTNKGFLPPRMTTSQINDIPSPPEGLIVYNTTLNTLMNFNDPFWNLAENRDGRSCGEISYGGQTYHAVIKGTHCWMKENLNIGTAIPGNQDQTNNSIIEKYCYDNLESNCSHYGGLYQWDEMMNYLSTSEHGICPPGWHIPSDDEFSDLSGHFNGGMLKETGTVHWASPNLGATNASGFTALPAGIRSSNGNFGYIFESTYFWSGHGPFGIINAYILEFDNSDFYEISGATLTYGYSVRCVKDD